MELDKILLEQDITYEKIKEFINSEDEDNYYKILWNKFHGTVVLMFN